jgi:hypothetical protein
MLVILPPARWVPGWVRVEHDGGDPVQKTSLTALARTEFETPSRAPSGRGVVKL